MRNIINLVQAIQVVRESKSRIPPELEAFTFFGEQDLWLFDARGDTTVRCPLCFNHDGNIFPGTNIRFNWPYLVIMSQNMIGGPAAGGDGLVHPNCRCRILRVEPKEVSREGPYGRPKYGSIYATKRR